MPVMGKQDRSHCDEWVCIVTAEVVTSVYTCGSKRTWNYSHCIPTSDSGIWKSTVVI